MRYPTVKTIQSRLNCSYAEARAVRGIMDGTFKTKRFPAVKKWIAQCYNMPSLAERKMCAIDSVLRGHGVEEIRRRGMPFAEYVNMSDTYAATVVRFRTGTYRIACWGDIVESNRL